MRSVIRGELEFDVVDAGPPEGERVVLLHGFPQMASSWDLLAPLLHERGYRTLAMNQRGYSPRARPRGRGAYRVTELAGDVSALIDAVGRGPVHVVGHDWGAVVGWVLATVRPDQVRTLSALSVPHPMAFAQAMATSLQGLASWYMYLFQVPWLPELLLGPDRPGGRARLVRLLRLFHQSEDGARRDADQLAAPGAFTAALNWYRAMPLGLARSRQLGSRVQAPTLMVWSDRDGAVRRKGVELTPRYVAGPYRLEVLRGVSHWIPDEAPRSTAELITTHIAEHGY